MQTIRFNDLEGLRIAAEMEKRGEAFYRRAARISKNREAVALLNGLAEEEALHAAEFERLGSLALGARDEEETLSYYDEEVSAYLSAVAAEVVFSGGLMDLGRNEGFNSPEAILEAAIDSEKDSILFYTEMIANTRDEAARTAFSEIVRQEKNHLSRLKRLLIGLTAG